MVMWSVGRKTFSEDSSRGGEKTCCAPTAGDDKCGSCLLCAICMACVKNARDKCTCCIHEKGEPKSC